MILAGQGRGKASSGCSEEASLSQRSGGWRGAGVGDVLTQEVLAGRCPAG